MPPTNHSQERRGAASQRWVSRTHPAAEQVHILGEAVEGCFLTGAVRGEQDQPRSPGRLEPLRPHGWAPPHARPPRSCASEAEALGIPGLGELRQLLTFCHCLLLSPKDDFPRTGGRPVSASLSRTTHAPELLIHSARTRASQVKRRTSPQVSDYPHKPSANASASTDFTEPQRLDGFKIFAACRRDGAGTWLPFHPSPSTASTFQSQHRRLHGRVPLCPFPSPPAQLLASLVAETPAAATCHEQDRAAARAKPAAEHLHEGVLSSELDPAQAPCRAVAPRRRSLPTFSVRAAASSPPALPGRRSADSPRHGHMASPSPLMLRSE